jgi:DNA-binding response OmpR family regulator
VAQPPRERYVLVVEDDSGLRELYRLGLTAAGFTVVAVEDGVDALRAIRDRRPHVVILDLGLPRLSGRQVLRELRADVTTRHLPVIIVTGTDAADLALKYSAHFFKKPLSAGELANVIHRCTDVVV